MSVQEKENISRRGFLKLAGIAGSALCLGLYVSEKAEASVLNEAQATAAIEGVELAAWIIINTDGKVTLISHRAEMGQGVYHSIAQIIAEELEVDLYKVDIQFAQGDEKKFGSQLTGGSSTIRGSYKNLLKLSATARQVLIQAAANRWNVPAAECYAALGHVHHKPSGKSAHYGELVADAAKLTAPANVKLKARADYKVITKPLHRRDSPLKTNGEAIFGIDKRLPGLQFAVVERNPRLRGKVKSFDATAALKVPGVTKVFKVVMGVWTTDREGVAVVANSTWAAMQGKKALKVEWDDTGFEHISTAEIFTRQRELLKTSEGLPLRTQGDPNGVIAGSADKLDVVYETPYQSHSCMEPVNCIAHFQGDKVEIWGPVQAPNWIQDYVSKKMGLAPEKVIVNMTFLGGGFGRKAMPDYPHEAAVISKEIGAPVQVVWTREDDATQGPYRPGISYRCEGVVENGAISALKFRMAGQNNDHWRSPDNGRPNRSTSEGFLKPYYDSIKNLSFSDVPFKTPIPTSFWRSVYASTNGFAYESFLDEIAHKAGKDPLALRREYLKDERLQKLIDKMEAVSGWKSRRKNQGFGAAITECFGSTVGHIVKVSKKTGGGIHIDKVWVVVDCGWYVNPDIIKAQVEGSVVMGLGAATIHEITFKDGMVEQRNFYDYKMPRITDIPLTEVHIIDNDADAGGMGEPGLPAFAPALTNAIFDLTGKRIRKLPFDLNAV
ncbi:molybdopterin cofactor-binding domain-containing protein [Mucilaginibacter myungsuensis]|uniref:Xanthine dehydrogenase family protein molybdopterin-binding subunit n=1 Tax=Mucilaginibacter myungsuensis TaxID=649104 RepID=A0A929KYX5_9SPHI|nr:molybdopterin cofactor-binding domain-containing protein [Mucilaginibacter myungsuensis]MBE9663732.1 xanthine dehydrogenase family protein molybdopterin-binding subunit [Mucilaginibacter myungsuensis]MDN3598944.1 molybdopterin-dependent oxidoreductase [Mucilaginibacter myungsuensis]